MAVPRLKRKVFTNADAARLQKGISALRQLLTRNSVLTPAGVPFFTYAEAVTIQSVHDRLEQIQSQRAPLK